MHRVGKSIINDIECFVVEENFICTAYPINAQNERPFAKDIHPIDGCTIPQYGELNQTTVTCEDATKDGSYRLYLPGNSRGVKNMQFSSPIILTGSSPFLEKTYFTEIKFLGGAVNLVKRCGNVTYKKPEPVSLENGEKLDLFYKIGFIDDSDEYCFDMNTFENTTKLTFGAKATTAFDKNGTTTLRSSMSIAFDQPQLIENYDSIKVYLLAVKDFLSFLIGQRNISFDEIQVSYITECDSKQVANVEYNSMYSEVCNRKYGDQAILKIDNIKDHTPMILELFFAENTAPWIQYLPERNEFINHVYGHTVTDIIVATEKEADLNVNIKKDRSNAKNVKLLYQHYDSEIASILPNFPQPIIHDQYDQDNKDDIDLFVDVRNKIQHRGMEVFSDQMKFFIPIKCAVYLSVLERAGIAESDRKSILQGWIRLNR